MCNEIPSHIVRKINRYEPVEVDGLTFYPIRVCELEDFYLASQAIEFMQQSLPVGLMSKPLLQAYYSLELDAISKNEEPVGLLTKAIFFLLLSLRVGEGMSVAERINLVKLEWSESDHTKLMRLLIPVDGEIKSITPIQFQKLRPILAEQNGIKLQSDFANPDLVDAERTLSDINGPEMDIDLEQLKTTVAILSHRDISELEDWAILKFERYRESAQRVLGYIICGIGESQGTTWKSGNPYPSPFFNKARTGSNAVVDASSFAGGAGQRAIQNAGEKTA